MTVFARLASPFALVTVLAVAACGSSEETELATLTPSATPTLVATVTRTASATPTETTPPEAGGDDGFLVFAAQIAAAADASDAAFFADRGLEEEVICAGDELLGFCEGEPAGMVFRGIPGGVAQSDAFALLSPDEFADMFSAWFGGADPALDDEFGTGAVALFATAYRPANEFEEEAYQAILTGIFAAGAEAERQARIISFRFVDGRWRLAGELFATRELTAEPYLTGECCPDNWGRWEE